MPIVRRAIKIGAVKNAAAGSGSAASSIVQESSHRDNEEEQNFQGKRRQSRETDTGFENRL
ncbi:MAG: hypothetical protein OSJ58_05765 [Dysosmobacter sp.]|nr:hypothetical protein [Dysosmobacter sp.]